MGTRWKGRGCESRAQANPISEVTTKLREILKRSKARGTLTGLSVLLPAGTEESESLASACYGRPITTADVSNQWLQLGLEEAFFLFVSLKCLELVDHQGSVKSELEVWQHMISRNPKFPEMYIAYSHLRSRNWVVRAGSQYGADFVAYRHHPSTVHSEYAVIVCSEGKGKESGRLRVWSDVHCAVRLCASVAKTLLVINVADSGDEAVLPWSLDRYVLSHRTISRWVPQKTRED